MRMTLSQIVLTLTLGLLSAGPLAMAGDLVPLAEADRKAIDCRVMEGPDLRLEEPKKEFYGALARWSIARTPMKADDELALAREEHRAILQSFKTSPAPPLAGKVLKQLTGHLPEASPREFEWTLTIIETPEMRSSTVGGGFLYLTRPLYDALTHHPDQSEDRLAFVLAHEMGHTVRKHVRVAYQLVKLEDVAQREGRNEEELFRLRNSVGRMVEVTGKRLRFLYEPHHEYQADLFAAHLCRNAGFDLEAGLDVLRQGVLDEEQGEDPLKAPANAMLSNPKAAVEKNRPSASERLRQIRLDVDGVIIGEQYGLWEFDAKADQWIKPKDIHVAEKEHAVLMVHGMDSTLSTCYIQLARALSKDRDFRGVRILGFQYPGDASLCRVGEFLHRELTKSFHPNAKVNFVCHSAGGLVVRYYAEVKGGPFERIILQGTPNHGSDLARLRSVVEMKQFVSDLRDGYSEAIEKAILDGQEQIGQDLAPGSLFLNQVNACQADRSRYVIFRGRRFGRARMLLLDKSMDVGRTLLAQSLEEIEGPEILRERAMQSLEQLDLPEEVRKGDLVVSTESAVLEGVQDIRTFKLRHGELSRDKETIAATLEILKSKP